MVINLVHVYVLDTYHGTKWYGNRQPLVVFSSSWAGGIDIPYGYVFMDIYTCTYSSTRVPWYVDTGTSMACLVLPYHGILSLCLGIAIPYTRNGSSCVTTRLPGVDYVHISWLAA